VLMARSRFEVNCRDDLSSRADKIFGQVSMPDAAWNFLLRS
jgi:hypothetical protein